MEGLLKGNPVTRPGRWAARALIVTALAAILCVCAQAQYQAPYVGLTGSLSGANGMPASNYGLTFVPSQVMYVGGTSMVVSNANCGTDTNGAVVGVANPNQPAVLNAISGTGTVPPGNYYVEVVWQDSFSHQTLASPEAQIQLTVAGSIQVSPPIGGAPASALLMNVYIGTASGAETYQGHIAVGSTYTQSVPLTTGASLPVFNATVCYVVANDAAWPIGGYQMNVTTPAGNNVPGFPQSVQFVGPGSAFNISNGLPLWNGRVTFPVPILTLPYNHNAQSISGPLSMTGYKVYNVGALGVGTALPAWGVDVEGSGAPAAINANQGYLVNGAAGTSGQCLTSDGTYFDTAAPCVSALPTIYYQTMMHSGSNLPQHLYLSDGPGIVFSDVSGHFTQVAVSGTGSDAKVVTASAAGTSGDCMQWSSTGGATDAGAPCAVAQSRTCNANGCYRIEGDGTIEQWGQTTTFGGADAGTFTLTFPHAFTSLTNLEVVLSPSQCVGGSPSYCAGVPGGTPNDVYACFVETASLTAPTVVYSAGATVVAGASCYWHAYGN